MMMMRPDVWQENKNKTHGHYTYIELMSPSFPPQELLSLTQSKKKIKKNIRRFDFSATNVKIVGKKKFLIAVKKKYSAPRQ